MDLLPQIKHRRSIRKFKKTIPGRILLKKILEAGRWAPSGLNNQPWRFIVISDCGLKRGLSKFSEYSGIIEHAPLLIVVLMDIKESYNRKKDFMAIGACIENMLLEASSLKLGACWLGEILNKDRQVLKYLKLKKGLQLMAVIALGYPKPLKNSRTKRKPLAKLTLNHV